ncbi:hypothetical protein DOE78_24265 [Bacillus sp. Y1]|nr:hypothetical protein [Bacillus sp. Y1]AYA78266.1 hypothetical protein DOE78_24265 [Bacillus sp. Y1]
MIQRCKGNESGAALMIVLFIVVLVSIVGTAMLSTTTYGLQNVVKTKKEQEEFYRAEGAIEIVLSEMSNYKNASTGNSGPYAYLKEVTGTRSYNIGGKDVRVDILLPSNFSTLTPSATTKSVSVTLEARYKDNSVLIRKVALNIDYSANPLTETKNAYNIYNYDAFLGANKGTYDRTKFGPITILNYDTIVSSLASGNTIDSIDKHDLERDMDYTFPSGVTRIQTIRLSGKNTKIIIPNDAIVYVKEMDLKGSGQNTQIVVNGVLIVDELHHGGSSILQVNSGIIVRNAHADSNAFEITGEGKGISCSLLEVACQQINGTQTKDQYTSIIQPSSLNFSTNR